jgi:hypothetical protein
VIIYADMNFDISSTILIQLDFIFYQIHHIEKKSFQRLNSNLLVE